MDPSEEADGQREVEETEVKEECDVTLRVGGEGLEGGNKALLVAPALWWWLRDDRRAARAATAASVGMD